VRLTGLGLYPRCRDGTVHAVLSIAAGIIQTGEGNTVA